MSDNLAAALERIRYGAPDYRTLQDVSAGRDLDCPGTYVRLARIGLVKPSPRYVSDRALTARGLEVLALGYPGLLEVRTGDRGTAHEWTGPAVRHGSGVAWCDSDGRHTGGGSYPGPQDVRPLRVPCDRCGLPAVLTADDLRRTGPMGSCCDACRAAARPALAGACASTDEPTPCPNCGSDALEASAGLWAKSIRLERTGTGSAYAYVLRDFFPAGAADDPDAGVNVGDEARVSCADCGHEVDADCSAMLGAWTFRGPQPVLTDCEGCGEGTDPGELTDGLCDRCAALTLPRTIDRYGASLTRWASAVLELAAAQDVSDPDDVSPATLELLEIDPDDTPHLDAADAAREVLEARILEVTRTGSLPLDGSTPEVESVRLLLGYGGPTVTLTVPADPSQRPTLWHSWGEGPESDGKPATLELEALEGPQPWTALVALLGPVWELEG